ncbi:uncharacterized protein Z518_06763 [Rhinocladiella mackenziei CBS 650.93]|uniref:Uncharacterized protein n=1 Tax=Rhinocladiella mackenziei CBS 650.93 TaxID=1442369 RepID=A0A0D2IIU0_9EURO|nr:uncharacterized protein Z518_06763 [Rhinocladiella mackenziei CBS 650.93]KIX03211.1 hypothetical protein Z518_06763 [Rhinocladiella mackenziei CBS 650.93]
MTTLFDNTGLPLWVYIVLIVVGSILLLVVVACLIRCWLLRRNSPDGDLDGLTGPTRRVTLRRGRMVPTSQHLSLTGSKFGMRQFGTLADNESIMTGRKSPFEWWNSILERSQSRQDRMSQVETASITTRPASRATTLRGRRELLTGTPTLTPEKNKEPVTGTWELTTPSPTPSPTYKTINFSRSFSSRTPSSPLTQRSQVTLSRISERSPHQSMISMSTPNLQNRSSYHSAIHPVDNTPLTGQSQPNPHKSMTLTVLAANTPSSKTSPPFPRHNFTASPLITDPIQEQFPHRASAAYAPRKSSARVPSPSNAPQSSLADANTSSTSLPETNTDDFPTPTLPMPRPVASPASRPHGHTSNSLYQHPNQSQLDLSHRASVTSTSPSRKSSMSVGRSGIVYDSQIPEYWPTRTDLHNLPPPSTPGSKPSGTSSSNSSRNGDTEQASPSQDREGEKEGMMGIVTVPGKNNSKVLRKKSLRRTQVVSSIAT